MAIASTAVKVLVAIIAILIGISQYDPSYFFLVPNVGFILYAMSGGNIPPFIIHETLYEEGHSEWLQTNDVIVSAAAKSGTTWMLFCSHQIRVKGNDEKYPFKDIMYNTPWMELAAKPGDTWGERRVLWNTTILPDGTPLKDEWDHPDYPFRVFKSHQTPDTFEHFIGDKKNKKKNVKFLAMARNGLDQVASAAPFFDKHSDEFRTLWGGFPPADGGSGPKKAKVASERLQQMLPGNIFSAWHFDYVNKWWEVKDEENVLLLHFSDAKKDLPRTVSQLADFYGVTLSKEQKSKIVDKCGFEHMKKNTHLFNYKVPLNPNFKGAVMKNGSMTRNGTIGDGKIMFTDEEKATWIEAEQKEFGDDPEKLNWIRNGRF